MPELTSQRSILIAIALSVAVVTSVGCRSASTDAQAACESLASARDELEGPIAALEAMPRALPTDALRYTAQTEAELVRFAALLEEINMGIDAMHDEHEVSCKWSLIDNDNVDGVFEAIYDPHIKIVTRQIKATRALANRLSEIGPPEVVGDAVARYRQLADRLASELAAQVAVCEADFDEVQCDRFVATVAAALAQPKALTTAPTGASPPAPADGTPPVADAP